MSPSSHSTSVCDECRRSTSGHCVLHSAWTMTVQGSVRNGTGNQPFGNVDLFPKVQGRCPACGSNSLFLGDGGYVTCSVLGCPDPCAASNVLEDPDAS